MRRLIAVAVACAAVAGAGVWAMGHVPEAGVALPLEQATVPDPDAVDSAAVQFERSSALRDAAVARQNKALDVGDPDSFGRPVRWLGTLSSPFYFVDADCSSIESEYPCLQTTAGTLSVSLQDVARMTLPARSTHSILCHWQTPQMNGIFENTGGDNRQLSATMYPSITLESEVLKDPALIDPETGLPMNGKLLLLGSGSRLVAVLDAGETITMRHSDTRACVDGTISKQGMMDYYGLSEVQARQLFAKPMTLRLNLDAYINGMTAGYINFAVRYVGD